MPSTFLALQVGVSALQTSQMGVNTTGHNIANANTPGYAREVTDVEEDPSLPIYTNHQTYLGEGVNSNGQNRVDDQYVDGQYRDNNSQESYWQSQNTELNTLGQVFNEPSGTTLRQSIDNFSNAWNQLAQTPTDTGARAAVYEAAQQLTDSFHTTSSALQADENRYAAEMQSTVDQINSLAKSIANLNGEIETAQASGSAPNDLLDQRDALLDQLSSYVPLQVAYTPDASNPSVTRMTVSISNASGSSTTLVTDGQVTNPNPFADPATGATDITSIKTAVSGIQNSSGSLKSLYDMYNYIVDPSKGVSAQIDNLAKQIASDVNASPGVDLNGNTGTPIFNGTPTGASDIAVNSAFGNPPNFSLIGAASSTNASTDGSNAADIAEMFQTQSFDSTYSSVVSQVGTDGQTAIQQNQTFTSLTTQASQLRQSVSGVDINQEMANMIEFQQSYNAASKFISVFNDMLTTLIQSV